MKKIFYSILALTGLLATSCLQNEEPMVVFDPEKVTAPQLAAVEGVTLKAEGEALSWAYTAVDFGYTCATGYALWASGTEDFAEKQKVSASFADGKITVEQKALNTAIINLGGIAEEEFTLYLKVNAYMLTNNNSEIARTNVSSNVQKAVFTSYNMDVSDSDVYDHVWVIGDYSGWDFAKSQHLYNYSGDGTTYEGVIDFADKAANGFKISGAAEWVDTMNWGTDGSAEDPASEASSIQLISSGGSGNISCYSKRFYHFTFNKTTAMLNMDWSMDQVGVIGDFNGWGGDVVMEYNPTYVRFYADVEITSAGGLKFRADATWGPNEWGAGSGDGIVALKGGNISVEAGNYRIYLDLNKMTYELNANMYGKPEPGTAATEPEPSDPTAWSVIGTVGGSSWDTDYDLVNTEGGTWVIEGIELTASDEFKLRADHAWTIQAGGPEANATSTIDPGNPYEVFKATVGEPFTAKTDNGKNIQVGIAGIYDITYDTAAGTILIENHE